MQSLFMRKLIFIISFTIASLSGSLSLAQGWSTYVNARYGATAEVPPGFEPAGPEANNSDGMIFRTPSGGFLTIYGADVPGRDFEAKVHQMIENETSYNGWPIASSTITPDWAEYGGKAGSRQLRVRVLSACNGKHVVVMRFDFPGSMARDVERVARSLTAGSARSC